MNLPPLRDDFLEKEFFSKGLAVCEDHIITDTFYVRFRDEEYDIPTRYFTKHIWQHMKYDRSSFDSIPIRRIRSIAKKLKLGKANG